MSMSVVYLKMYHSARSLALAGVLRKSTDQSTDVAPTYNKHKDTINNQIHTSTRGQTPKDPKYRQNTWYP